MGLNRQSIVFPTVVYSFVYRAANYKLDSANFFANQLLSLSKQKGNIKYQLKAICLFEYLNRVLKKDYVEAMKNNYKALKLMEKSVSLKKFIKNN